MAKDWMNVGLDELANSYAKTQGQTASDLDSLAQASGIKPQTQNDGILDNIVSGLKSGGAGVVGGIADLLHADSVGDYMQDVQKSNQRARDYDSVLDWNYWTDPSGATYDVANAVGSMAALAPAALALPESAAAGGAGALATLLGRIGLGRAATWAGTQAAKKGGGALGTYIRGAATAIPESMAEGGGVRREAMENGLDDADLRAWKAVGLNLPTLALSNGLEYALLGGNVFNPSAKASESLLKRAAKAPLRAAPAVAANAGQNAVEELLQTTISNAQLDQPWGNPLNPFAWTDEQRKAAEIGAVVGGALGGSSNAYHAMRVSDDETPTKEPSTWNPTEAAGDFLGKRMDNGDQGCVEAVTKIGANGGNSFLKDQLDKGVVYVPTLVKNAGDMVIPFDESQLQAGDVIVYGDDDHVVIYDGNGGYVGNSSSQMKVVHGSDYTAMDDLRPTKIIKTGGQGGFSPSAGQREGHENAWAIYDVFHNAGYNDNAIAGILGRVQQEHNFDTSNVDEYDDPETGMHLGGYGMFQWNGGRTQAFLNWAKENNLDPQSATVQAQYALMEAEQRGLTPDRMNGLSHEEAATLWTDEWEVGRHGEERKYAGEWLERIGKGGNAGGSTKTAPSQQSQTVDTFDEDSLYEGFAREQLEASRNSEDVDFFGAFFNDKGKFKNTEENVAKIRERAQGDLAEEYEDYVKRQKAKQKPVQERQGKSAQNAPEIQTSTNNLDAVRQKLEAHKEAAIDRGDYDTLNTVSSAIQSRDARKMQRVADSLPDIQPSNPVKASEPVQTEGTSASQIVSPPSQTEIQTVSPETTQGQATEKTEATQPVESVVPQQATTPAQPQNVAPRATSPQPIQGQVQSAQNQGVNMRAAYENGMAPMAETKEERQKQGKGLILVARTAGVTLPKGMAGELRKGSTKAIPKAQKFLRDAGVSLVLDEFIPISSDELNKVTGGIADESTTSTETKGEKRTTGTENQDSNAESEQAEEKGEVGGKTTPQNRAGEAKEGTRKEIPPEEKNPPHREAQGARDHNGQNKEEKGEESQQSQPGSLTNTTYTTKKGEVRPAVTWDGRIDKEEFDRRMKLAKEHNGWWNSRTKTFAFKNEQDRDAFVSAVNGTQAEPASNEGGEKSAQNEGNKPELHFSDLEKAMKSSGRDVLIKALEHGYKPVGRNTIEAPDGTKYVVSDKAYGIFEKDYQNKQAKANPEYKKRIYFREKSGSTHYMPTQAYDNSNPYRTDEERMKLLAERGAQVITKEEYDADHMQTAAAQMKKFFDEDNLEKIFAWVRSNDNVYSIKALSNLMGVQLDKTWKRRKQQLIEYYGDKYTKWQEKVAEDNAEKERNEAVKQEQERQKRTEEAEKDWNDGKAISGEDFLLLCDKYDVDVSISTKGVIKNKLDSIKNDGTIYGAKVKKYPQGLASVYTRLKDAMEETAPDEVVDSLFSKGGTKAPTKAEENSEPRQEKPAEAPAANSYNGFTDSMAPMQKARAANTLAVKVKDVDGKTEVTRAEYVEKAVADDRAIQKAETEKGVEYRIYTGDADSSYVKVTKTEYDYAKYLGAKPTTDKVVAKPEQKQEKSAKDKKADTTQKSGEKLEDFGEYLYGARKDYYGAYSQKLETAEKTSFDDAPLSKCWPEPDYAKLLENNVDPKVVSFVRALRDVVSADMPNKHSWRYHSWKVSAEKSREYAFDALKNNNLESINKDNIIGFDNVQAKAKLYEEFGHDVSLKKINIKKEIGVTYYKGMHEYRGTAENPLYVVEGLYGKNAITPSNSYKDVLNKLKEYIKGLQEHKGEPQNADDKFKKKVKVGKERGENNYMLYVNFSTTSKWAPLKAGFETPEEARAYRDAHIDELKDIYEELKKEPAVRRPANSLRVGTDYRNGKDITPAEFSDTFGFRGVQFGNWVEKDRRQLDINEAYDALLDLAGVLNISPRALSLGGELGLAFGSRGVPNASAHYEPGTIVINLSKKKGAGSLAHEWFHSVDHYLSRKTETNQERFMTEGMNKNGRKPLVAAFQDLRNAFFQTGLEGRSEAMDYTRSKPYYSKNVEMGARAFEAYVIKKLKQQGMGNDFLANIQSEETFRENDKHTLELFEKLKDRVKALGGTRYPYPLASEMKTFEDAFDKIFDVIEEKVEDGKHILYSVSAESVEQMSYEDFLNAVKDEFPYAKDFKQEGNAVSFALPGGQTMHIDLVDKILFTDESKAEAETAYGRKFKEGETAKGQFQGVGIDGFITLIRTANKGTLSHEAYHMARQFLPKNEQDFLSKRYKNEEEEAEAYRKWRTARNRSGMFSKLWQQVQDIASSIAELLSVNTEHAVFRQVESGEVYKNTKNQLDNSDNIRDNVSEEVFDKYLTEGIMQMVQDTVSKEIGEYVDLSKMRDPVARDEARDKLPYIRELLVQFNDHLIQEHPKYKDRLAVKIEYARRCFDNDERIRNEAVRQMDGYEGQAGVHQNRTSAIPGNNRGTSGGLVRAVTGGVSRSVGHEKHGAREHFEKLYNEQMTKHSNQGAFSSAKHFSIDGKPIVGVRKYSLDPSSNDTRSTLTRIKHILTGRVDGYEAKQQYRKRMTDMLGKTLGVKIRYGKQDARDGKDTVVYKENDKVIRSSHAYDWENILPVASDLVMYKLNIPKTEPMRNYITDWILEGAPNNTSKEAKDFHKAMQEHPSFAERMIELRQTFQEWNEKSIQEQMHGVVQWEKNNKTTWSERINSLTDEFVESFAPIERLVESVQDKMGRKLSATVNPAVLFRLYRGSYGRVITMIDGEGQKAVNALQTNFPGVNFDGFKTLHTIMKEIGAFQNVKKQREFIVYCMSKHILDMHKKNIDLSLEQEHLKRKKAELEAQNKEDNKEKIAEYGKQIEKLEEEKFAIPKEFSMENCEATIKQGEKEFGQAQKDLVRFSNTTAAILYDSGVISDKRFNELLNSWPNYVPLFRVFEENEDINFGDSMKHIKGSMRDIVNPLESIIKNTVEFVKKAEKNKAKCALADLARCEGSGWLLEEVENTRPNDKTTITFYENGQKKYLQTDPSVVKAVNSMNPGNSSSFIKVMHAITKIGRACFTMANPEFASRNILRDYFDAVVYGKDGFISPMDLVRAIIDAVTKSETYYEWLSSGAAQASTVSLDRNYTKEMIDKMGRSLGKRLLSRDFPKAFLEVLQKAGEYSEYATRIARYKKSKQTFIRDKKQEAYEAIVGAAFESRDLMDFARKGNAGETWNKLVPFANASIQGLNKFWREACDPRGWREDPQRMARTWARLILTSVLPAMLFFMLNKDEDWYEEGTPEWVKETHWVFKLGDTTFRIPKGNDLGIRFLSNAVEKGMAESSGKDEYKWYEYVKPIYDAMPNLITFAFLPILEIAMNHSMFTKREIVPRSQEKLPAKLQYSPYNTSFSRYVGEKLGISPRYVDHAISGYGGSMGMLPFKLYDVSPFGDRQLDTAVEEFPFTRSVTYMPYKNPKSVQKYYEQLDEQTKLENEYKLTKQKPEGYDPALLKRLKAVKKDLLPLAKKEKEVIENPNYTVDQRREIQNKIQQRRINIVKRVIQ